MHNHVSFYYFRDSAKSYIITKMNMIMKKLGLLMMLLLLSRIALFCQSQTAGIEEKEVLKNEDVVFRQIDEHT